MIKTIEGKAQNYLILSLQCIVSIVLNIYFHNIKEKKTI